MYQKWDITFYLHLPRFYVFFSPFFRLSFVNPIVIMPAFRPENRPLTSCVLSVRRRRDCTHNGILSGVPNAPKWHKIRWSVMPKRNRIDTFDDGLSSRSMTTTAAKGANNAKKKSQFGADNATFMSQFPSPDHTFPWVLLGFLHIFPNKKPLSSGFLEGFQNVI